MSVPRKLKPAGSNMTFKLSRAKLVWEHDDFEWHANSKYQCDGVPFQWKINCCEDGLFTIEHSTHELLYGLNSSSWNYETLAAAKAFCEEHEAISQTGKWKKESEIESALHLAALRPHSIVVRGERLFPPIRKSTIKSFSLTPKEDEVSLDVDSVLRTAAVAIRLKTGGKDGWNTVARDIDRLASLEAVPYKLDIPNEVKK